MEAIASADPFLASLATGLAGQVKTRRTLVAVSGGRDSVALLHGLHALGWKKLVVLHLDHRLRGRASTGDARWVARLAKSLGHPCEVGRADVRGYAKERGISLEHAARELRLVFFAAAARRTRCRTVLLAHHADDQVETCLFNFLRGSGPAGLAGMKPVSTQTIAGVELSLVRPLLAVRRSEIDAWVSERRIPWRDDATNAGCEPTRNRMRQKVIPLLRREMGDAFPDAILRAAAIFSAEEQWMAAETDRMLLGDTLAVADLKSAPLALRRRLVRRWLIRCGVAECGFAETERVLSLLAVADGPAKINLPGGRHARRRAGILFLEAP